MPLLREPGKMDSMPEKIGPSRARGTYASCESSSRSTPMWPRQRPRSAPRRRVPAVRAELNGKVVVDHGARAVVTSERSAEVQRLKNENSRLREDNPRGKPKRSFEEEGAFCAAASYYTRIL